MDLVIVFAAFTGCMAVSLILNVTMLAPLSTGLCLFVGLAVKRGFTIRSVMGFVADSFGDSFIVIKILLIIGCLTGLWRLSGTVAYFVSFGISVIPSQVFLLAAFLMAAAMSYALGTSFGVTATAGVILISIARAAGVNTVLAAGAIYSGIYVGDRGSPAASSANLVAVITHTDMRKNVREMLKCSILPFLLCCLIYGLMSLAAPMRGMDTGIQDMLAGEFRLQWYCIMPALIMIVLPFCGVDVKLSMLISLTSSLGVAMLLQNQSLLNCLKAMVMGFTPRDEALDGMLSGGGILSMLEICGILLLSCSYGGIFRGTGMLSSVNRRLSSLASSVGRFPVMLLLGAGVAALFCNQTIGAIMQSQLSEELYGDGEEERNRKMLDMENSVILLSGLVPWCLASSVPLTMLGADARSLPVSFYLWLMPLFWLLQEKLRLRAAGEKAVYTDK